MNNENFGKSIKKGQDLRSPLAKARDEYFQSNEGKKMCEGGASGQYLKSRLERAFIAGWDLARNNVIENAKKNRAESDPKQGIERS